MVNGLSSKHRNFPAPRVTKLGRSKGRRHTGGFLPDYAALSREWGAAICVGSNAIYRRSALAPVGGIVPVEFSEDICTGIYVITHGWTIKNIPLNLACGICPDTPRAFFSQQTHCVRVSYA